MEKKYMEIGKIVSAHGLKGEVNMLCWCEGPEFLKLFDNLYYDKELLQKVEISSQKAHKNMAILKIAGINSIEETTSLRGRIIYADRNEVELPEGMYFVSDLEGVEVIDVDTKESYGVITDVTQTGANDVYHIKQTDGKIVLIPAIKDVIINTNLESGIMEIRPLKGLFDDED